MKIRSLEYVRSDSRSSRRAYSRLVMPGVVVVHCGSEASSSSSSSSSARSVASSSSSGSPLIDKEGVDIDSCGVRGRGLFGVVGRRECSITAERGWSSKLEQEPKLWECTSGMSDSYMSSEGSSASSAMGARASEREGE